MSVDKSLGEESNVVTFSLVGDFPGLIEDLRRLLVAMSRAKDSLVVLADWELRASKKSQNLDYLRRVRGLMADKGAFAGLTKTAARTLPVM